MLLPLIAPGIFVALLLVYIPLFTDFASPALVGGTEGYMLGNVVNDLVLESGDLNGGAAMSMLMLGRLGAVRDRRLPAGEDQAARIMSDERRSYDVAIVGGGHNGLVAAYYLASAGLRTVVLERREIVGGCCVTEEFAPGYRASTGAYVLSMLREPVWRDLRLVERGIARRPGRPVAQPVRRRLRAACSTTTSPRRRPRSRRFSAADARALPEFEAELGRDRRR